MQKTIYLIGNFLKLFFNPMAYTIDFYNGFNYTTLGMQ